jgi:hypothetical protein
MIGKKHVVYETINKLHILLANRLVLSLNYGWLADRERSGGGFEGFTLSLPRLTCVSGDCLCRKAVRKERVANRNSLRALNKKGG